MRRALSMGLMHDARYISLQDAPKQVIDAIAAGYTARQSILQKWLWVRPGALRTGMPLNRSRTLSCKASTCQLQEYYRQSDTWFFSFGLVPASALMIALPDAASNPMRR